MPELNDTIREFFQSGVGNARLVLMHEGKDVTPRDAPTHLELSRSGKTLVVSCPCGHVYRCNAESGDVECGQCYRGIVIEDLRKGESQ